MRHETKRILLIAATLCAAGCAKSDFQVARQNRGNMRSVSDARIANAPEEKPPNILPETHFAAGMLFERQGQFDKAIVQYRKAVALNHNYVVAFQRLGLVLSATGQHLEAAQTLQRAVALRPDNAVLRNNLGFEWMLAQQWDDAERELRRAIELQPDLATAHINLGLVQAKLERFSESLASFRAVLPEADAYYNLGLMFRGQQRYSDAAEAFRHVLTIDPEFSAAKVQLQQIPARTDALTPTDTVAETPQLVPNEDPSPAIIGEGPATVDLLALLDDMTASETANPPAPEFVEEEYAVPSEHKWGTTLADLAAMLAVIDADAKKNGDPPIEPSIPAEEFVEDAAEVGRESILAPETLAEAPTPADLPCEEEPASPSGDGPTEAAAVVFEEFEDDEAPTEIAVPEPRADEPVKRPTLAATVEFDAEPAPCDPVVEEVDADDVIVALAVDPTVHPTGVRDSWVMLEELEAKVAMLRYEIAAPRAEKAGFGDDAATPSVFAAPSAWLEQGPPIFEATLYPVVEDGPTFDDPDEPFIEFDEDDAAETKNPPGPSGTGEQEPCNDPSPSDRAFLWTTQFGDLDALLSIVRNETLCWEELDAEARDQLALAATGSPCVDAMEQAGLFESEEFSPAMSDQSEDSMSLMQQDEFTDGRMTGRSGDVFASQPLSLEPLPD